MLDDQEMSEFQHMLQIHPLFGISTRAFSAPPLYQTLSQGHVEAVDVFQKASEADIGSSLSAFGSLIIKVLRAFWKI